MDYLKDFIYLSKSSGKKTVKSMKKHWFIIFTGIIYSMINLLTFFLLSILFVGPLYILSGIVLALITSSLLSNYFYLLFNIINYDRLSLDDFKDGFTIFLRKIYSVLFIGYLGSLLLSLLLPMLGGISINFYRIIYLGIFLLLNPLPETLYLKNYSAWDSIVKSLDFLQENWLNWLLPNFLFMVLLYFITGSFISNLLSSHLIFSFIFKPKYIILYLLGQLIFSFMMIYRGFLYKNLSTSTMRKRKFMGKF